MAETPMEHFSIFQGEFYSARVLKEEEIDRVGLTYPGLVHDAWVKGLGVEIVPAEGTSWIARFASSQLSPNALTVGLYHPNPRKLCVLAGGAGYEVDVEERTNWALIPLSPIMGVIATAEKRAFIFWDYSRLSLMCVDGIVWTTPPISWDGVSNVSLDGDRIVADVWDAPTGKTTKGVVRLQDGSVLAGSSPELRS